MSESCLQANVISYEQQLDSQKTNIETKNISLPVNINSINVSIEPVISVLNSELQADITGASHSIIATINSTNTKLVANFSMLCSVGYDDREVFLVQEGLWLLCDGQTFSVLKK